MSTKVNAGSNKKERAVGKERAEEKKNERREDRKVHEERREEWYALYGQLDKFLEQKPQKHTLYEFAQQTMREEESCDFYRGAYDSLAKCLQFLDVSKDAARQQNEAAAAEGNGTMVLWEDMYRDMLRLLVGLSMSRALKRWPEDQIPKGIFE